MKKVVYMTRLNGQTFTLANITNATWVPYVGTIVTLHDRDYTVEQIGFDPIKDAAIVMVSA